MTNMTGRLRGWWLTDDANWEERKAQMNARTIERLATETKQSREIRPEPVLASSERHAVDPLACGEDCLECHGEGFTVDHTESAKECSRYRERRRRESGGDD